MQVCNISFSWWDFRLPSRTRAGELNDLIPLILLDFIVAKLKIKITLTNENVKTFELTGAFEHWLNFKIYAG